MQKQLRSLRDGDFSGRRVLVRVDHNIEANADGKLKNDEKIRATLPTIEFLLKAGAHIILMTHVGRPKGKPEPTLSTLLVSKRLQELLPKISVTHSPVTVGPEAEAAAKALNNGQILYLENVRFLPEEEGEPEQQAALGKKLAALGEIYVNEAFASCHDYEEASTCAVARLLPVYAGIHLEREAAALQNVLHDPARPLTLIMSGAKMETKIPVIERFLNTGQHILLGGCIANTFIAAQGFSVGTSKYEPDALDTARRLLADSKKPGSAVIHVPVDTLVAASPDAKAQVAPAEHIPGGQAIFDVGPASLQHYGEIIAASKTIVWNGPLGLYETQQFAAGSAAIAEALAKATATGARTILGGGDTLDFHIRYHHPLASYSFVSTGGGAMLEFIAGKPLPAIELLKK